MPDETLYTIGQVAEMLGDDYQRIYHLYRQHQLPDPVMVGGMRLVRASDVPLVKEALSKRPRGAGRPPRAKVAAQ